MNKLIISIGLLVFVASCKGPGAGPLAKDTPVKTEMTPNMNGQSKGSKVAMEKINVKVEPCKDCVKISDLLENKTSYSGKTVKVTGQVTKYNPQIMGKNWIHIQDGSEYKDGFDLTITTDKEVTVGQTITFEGKIVLDKDFGYGYFYSVLMEEAKPVL
jgi:hypothetical protein